MEGFQDVTATRRIFQLKKRIRAVSGGTWASKTVSILIWLIDYCQSTQGKIVTVVAESVPHLRLGAIRDFKNIMVSQGYWNDKRFIENPEVVYKFPTGSIIEFISFDKFGKAHGPRRDVLFINEANNIPYNIVDQLITRTREIIWLDWNPSEDFWFYTDFYPNRKEDTDFMGDGGSYPPLTYLDNEALDEVARHEVEAHKNNTRWWMVYGLGKKGELQGKIYTGWQIIDEIPHEARLERYGLDFGYSNDPTAIVAVYYYNGGYIWDEITFQKGLSNKQIADILLNVPKALVVADSAEPKSIDEIKSYEVNVIGVQKRKVLTPTPIIRENDNFVKWSIGVVQGEKISLTKQSVNIIKEYRNYLWMTDKNGKVLNDPEHVFSHSMDAGRYAMVSLRSTIQEQERLMRIRQDATQSYIHAKRNTV